MPYNVLNPLTTWFINGGFQYIVEYIHIVLVKRHIFFWADRIINWEGNAKRKKESVITDRPCLLLQMVVNTTLKNNLWNIIAIFSKFRKNWED